MYSGDIVMTYFVTEAKLGFFVSFIAITTEASGGEAVFAIGVEAFAGGKMHI